MDKAFEDQFTDPKYQDIADCFYLHQNLLETIKDVLRQEIPNKISLDEIEPKVYHNQNLL